MAAAKETGHFRGAGGTIWEMDLPLKELYGQQLVKGDLVRVNADGSTWTGGPTPLAGGIDLPVDPRDVEIARLQAELAALRADGAAVTDAGGGVDVTTGEVRKPAASASKADWVAYAVSQGMTVTEAEGATKNDLVALLGGE